MKPLANTTYFIRNKGKAIPLIAIIALSVVGVSVISVLANTQLKAAETAWLKPLEHFAQIFAAADIVDPSIKSDLANRPDIERLIAYQQTNIRVPTLMGSDGRPIFGLEEADLAWFMDRVGLTVAEGRLPDPGKAEIALHSALMRARGLALGDIVGQEVDEKEWLRGRWEIVGRLEGPIPAGVAPRDVVRSFSPLKDLPGEFSYLAFPREGQTESVEAYVESLPKDKVRVYTHSEQSERFREEFDSMKVVIWTIDIVTITVLSLAMGLLNTIYFMQRMGEYGTLAALGYSIGFLVRRTLSESMILTVAAWVFGLGLAQGLALALGRLVFEPRGITLAGLNLQAVYYTVPIPVLIAVFSVVAVVRQLYRLDPVTIVERRD